MKRYLILTGLILIPLLSLQAESYTLDRYLQLVEENSKDLYLARTDQRLAENQERQVMSANLPMIQGQAGYTRNFLDIEQPMAAWADGNAASAPLGIYPLEYEAVDVNRDNDFSLNVALQQNLFDMKIIRAMEASRKYQTLTGTVYEASRQGILTAGKKVFYQTILLNEVYEVKKATEQNAYETYLDIKKKFDNELASELDVLQAEVNWEINIPETTQAARNRDLAMSNLKHLAGIDPDEEMVLEGSLESVPSVPAAEELGGILTSRPDYQALMNEKELREINISAMKAEFYPSLSGSVVYAWQKSDDDFHLGDGINAFQAGLTLTIPVFYGGSRFAKMEQARLELDKSNMNLLKKQDEVQTQINNLQLLLDEASARIDSAETTLNTARKAYSIMEISTRNGLATQLDLKDALLNLDGAQLNYYKAIYDYLEAYFNWQQAVGEGDKLPRI